MRPRTIKAKLVQKGIKQADIARQLHVSRQSVNKTISGIIKSDKIESAISKAIGLPKQTVFPPLRRAA